MLNNRVVTQSQDADAAARLRAALAEIERAVARARDSSDAGMPALLARLAGDISFALDQLEAVDRELEAFSYSVAHDLRAPLRHIDGFARLLEKELGAPGGKPGHYLATIGAAANRMSALIDDLLQFSRTGRRRPALQRVEPGPLVQALIREAAPGIGERRVEWAVDELPAVMADPALLRIVLQALLSNALKFTRPRPLARIEVRARRLDGGSVELSVRDNGVGFDMGFADKLFGVFQRLHREEEFEGTGIGLATARRIVHRHGQRIRGEGAPEAGAAFAFTMAAAD